MNTSMNIQHNRPTFDRKEHRAVKTAIKSGWVAQGRCVEEFEDKFCNFMGIPSGHAVAVSSGSAALYIAILALGAKNQNIGLPAYTCAAIRNSITLASGKPIFIDCNSDSPNLDLNIAHQSDIHTLISVSTFGIPLSVSTTRKYFVIEDISQSLGALQNRRKAGLDGDIGVCSFSATKLMTTGGQGGIIFSKNLEILDFVRDYRNFDAREDNVPRFNFQMTDIQASIGSSQIEKLPDFIRKREEIFKIYSNYELDLIDDHNPLNTPTRYRAVIRNSDPIKLQLELKRKGIKTIIPYTYDELLSKTINERNAINLSKSTLSIPIYPSLSLKKAMKIAKSIKSAN